jgi:hypothetical protein
MKMYSTGRVAAAVIAAGATLAVTETARAADCSTVTNPVYVAGSSAIKNSLTALATPTLAAQHITLIYQSQGSCEGLSNFEQSTGLSGTALIMDGTSGGTTCTLTGNTTQIDVALADVYPATCPNVTLGNNQKDFTGGVVQAMTFVVPKNSTESSISDDAAYVVEGWGGTDPTYQIAPWTVPGAIHVRGPASGTQGMIGVAIGLVASKWRTPGSDAGIGPTAWTKGGDLANAVIGEPGNGHTNSAIGILSTGDADNNRSTLKILAFQYTKGGQTCGYLPDSDSTSRDKLNVRQGRYAIWGPLHAVAHTDGNGNAVPSQGNPAGNYVATAIKYLTNDPGLSDADRKQCVDAYAAANVIPMCAMEVSRSEEIGPETSSTPTCSCYFGSKVGALPSSCKTCPNGDGDCTSPQKCRYGYCEAK